MRNLLKPVRSCIFPVMCDEYTEVPIKEQLTFCMRWVNNDLEFFEKFLGFYKIPDIKIRTIVIVMKDILLRYQLKPDMCRGQCHDCASNMLRKLFGVATQFFAEQPKSYYTHCHAHSLLLWIKDAIKSTKILRDTMGTAAEITILIKYSPKRENILGSINENIECENSSEFHANNLLKLSESVQYVSKGFWITTMCYGMFENTVSKLSENTVSMQQ